MFQIFMLFTILHRYSAMRGDIGKQRGIIATPTKSTTLNALQFISVRAFCKMY